MLSFFPFPSYSDRQQRINLPASELSIRLSKRSSCLSLFQIFFVLSLLFCSALFRIFELLLLVVWMQFCLRRLIRHVEATFVSWPHCGHPYVHLKRITLFSYIWNRTSGDGKTSRTYTMDHRWMNSIHGPWHRNKTSYWFDSLPMAYVSTRQYAMHILERSNKEQQTCNNELRNFRLRRTIPLLRSIGHQCYSLIYHT